MEKYSNRVEAIKYFLQHSFPVGFWTERENQRVYLQILAQKFNVTKPSDWGKVDINLFKQEKGAITFLFNYHNKSLFKALQSNFPEIKWERQWFGRNSLQNPKHWLDKNNQRLFLEEFAKKHNVKEPKDWGKIRIAHIVKEGGSFITNYYQNSLKLALNSLYPDVRWNDSWFYNHPRSKYWMDLEKQREFLDRFSSKHLIVEPQDWESITLNLIKLERARGLLVSYNGSILQALKTLYPNEWENISIFQKENSNTSQLLLEHYLRIITPPHTQVLFDYKPKTKEIYGSSNTSVSLLQRKYD